DQGGQNRARFVLDALDHPMQLEAGPDQAPAMIEDLGMLELNSGGTDDRVQRFAGGIGDQVQVDAPIRHGGEDGGESKDRQRIVTERIGKAGMTVSTGDTVEDFVIHQVDLWTSGDNAVESGGSRTMRSWLSVSPTAAKFGPRFPQAQSTTPPFL